MYLYDIVIPSALSMYVIYCISCIPLKIKRRKVVNADPEIDAKLKFKIHYLSRFSLRPASKYDP